MSNTVDNTDFENRLKLSEAGSQNYLKLLDMVKQYSEAAASNRVKYSEALKNEAEANLTNEKAWDAHQVAYAKQQIDEQLRQDLWKLRREEKIAASEIQQLKHFEYQLSRMRMPELIKDAQSADRLYQAFEVLFRRIPFNLCASIMSQEIENPTARCVGDDKETIVFPTSSLLRFIGEMRKQRAVPVGGSKEHSLVLLAFEIASAVAMPIIKVFQDECIRLRAATFAEIKPISEILSIH